MTPVIFVALKLRERAMTKCLERLLINAMNMKAENIIPYIKYNEINVV